MNQLLSDMWDTLRLRYRPFETYQFPAWIYVLALLLCGISMAAVMQSKAMPMPSLSIVEYYFLRI